jgi:hypothetical protein
MNTEIPVDTHHRVGPLVDRGGHGPVTCIVPHLWVCLDCGYTAADDRRFSHVDCDRAENPINQTWRERLDKYVFPDAFDEREGERRESESA